MSFIYLGSPYSDHNPAVEHSRFISAEACVAQMLKQGLAVYSPIVHCHELARKYNLPKTFAFWAEYNYAMLEKAEALYVLLLRGYQESKGLTAEIAFAESRNIPVHYVTIPEAPRT